MTNLDTMQFESLRPLMFSIAYRMLGSASDAEDILQDAFLRYRTVPGETIDSPKAYLTTIVTRLCLNHLQSARNQREVYVGPWLPEPLLTPEDDPVLPHRHAELQESLSLAFLVLLEQLTPPERAVFLLREVFDYEYAEIAEIVGKEVAACRQILRRAKLHVAANRPRFKPAPETHRQMLDRFMRAVGSGRLENLLEQLAEDVKLWADSGGKLAGAIYRPLVGEQAVARFLLASAQRATPRLDTETSLVNGEPALILRTNGTAFLVFFLEIQDEQIAGIRVLGNPEKLKWLNSTDADASTDGETRR